MENSNRESEIIYANDAVSLPVKYDGETLWLAQSQMGWRFWRSVSVINPHVNCVFSEGELEKDADLHFMQIAFSDKPVRHYSLEVVPPVRNPIGFGVNEKETE